MRLFFIPGFGEDETIFDKIKNEIPGEKVFMNWDLIDETPRPELNALEYARELIVHFGITSGDVVIGHSTGGWIAWHMKHLLGCRIIQLASWTDVRKVVTPFSNRHFIYWTIKTGLFFNSLTRNLVTWKDYRKKPSRDLFIRLFTEQMKRNRQYVINQTRVIFNPVGEEITVEPDLRIHAKKDTIVRPPDESFHDVPGDHFSLYTYPQEVSAAIVEFLKENPVKA